MYNFQALIFIVFIPYLVDSQAPLRFPCVYDYIPEHRVSGENKFKEACIRADTGWWGTDVTPKIFNRNRMLIGFPLDMQYVTVELKMENDIRGANVCLCYKDKMQKKHRYKSLYTDEAMMHFFCSEEYSMLCYGAGYHFVGGNVAAAASGTNTEWYKRIKLDPAKPLFAFGFMKKTESHYSLSFEFSIADKVAEDRRIQAAAHLASRKNTQPFWISQFDVQRVTDIEDGREYNAISVLPIQTMRQRLVNPSWCFKGGRIITVKSDKEPMISTVEKDQFKALDDFEPFGVVKSDIEELFEFSRGSSHGVTWSMICLLFCFYFLPL